MSIKSDKWIRRMAQEHRMIEPFEAGQVRSVDDTAASPELVIAARRDFDSALLAYRAAVTIQP